MPVMLWVTREVVGTEILYEHQNQGGRTAVVPTYRMCMLLSGEAATRYPAVRMYEFAVTRDVSGHIFDHGQSEGDGPYMLHGECPPSRTLHPYRGLLHSYRGKTPAIVLYEATDDIGLYLVGEGGVRRRRILIHPGPGRSLGCMMIAGGMEGYQEFLEAFLRLYSLAAPDETILVQVDDRHEALPLSRYCG